MSNIRVVDVNNEEGKVNEVIPEVTNEEVKQEEHVEETKPEIKNDIIEETKEEVKEEVTEKPKRQTQKDKIQWPKCLKQVSIKTYKYSHENLCKGNLAKRPVKPHTKPKAKPTPKPEQAKGFLGSDASAEASRCSRDTVRAEPINEETLPPKPSEINPTQSENLPTRSEKPPTQPIHQINPLMSHYQLLQQEYMKQKQERFNNLFQGMVGGSRKKR